MTQCFAAFGGKPTWLTRMTPVVTNGGFGGVAAGSAPKGASSKAARRARVGGMNIILRLESLPLGIFGALWPIVVCVLHPFLLGLLKGCAAG